MLFNGIVGLLCGLTILVVIRGCIDATIDIIRERIDRSIVSRLQLIIGIFLLLVCLVCVLLGVVLIMESIRPVTYGLHLWMNGHNY